VGFPLVVVNDNAYGIIAYLQRSAFKKEYESRLNNPDIVALAHAYGAQATRVESLTGLEESIEKAFASDELWVIELAGSFPEPPFGRY
jgi:thiamine pyrophosphate-dependent acetolactate synthase large subunit-like protein